MFDIGFSELVVIGVVALVVLGPERLPKVARTAGHLFGRLQRYVATVKADLNREMEMSELSKVKQEVQEAARAFEQSTQQTAQAVETEARTLSESFEKAAGDSAATGNPPTQSQLLAEQEHGLTAQSDAAALAVPFQPAESNRVRPLEPAFVPAQQGMLDLGIEPVRESRT